MSLAFSVQLVYIVMCCDVHILRALVTKSCYPTFPENTIFSENCTTVPENVIILKKSEGMPCDVAGKLHISQKSTDLLIFTRHSQKKGALRYFSEANGCERSFYMFGVVFVKNWIFFVKH